MRWPRVLQGQVSRRLFGLFIAAALLPLSLTAWIADTAVGELVDHMSARGLAQSTRQTGLQVFDRMLAAKALLVAWPEDFALPAGALAMQAIPGGARLFSGVAHVGPDGQERWGLGASTGLMALWQRAQGDAAAAPVAPDAGAAVVRMRWLPPTDLHERAEGGERMRVLMSVLWHGQVRWVVALNDAYLWGPLTDVAAGSGWRVQDAQGPTLRVAGDAVLVPRPVSGGPRALSVASSAVSPLHLAAEFGARPWLFVQHQPEVQAQLAGLPLARWVTLLGMGTLLFVALVSMRQIQRTLVPLASLTEVTRRLGDGDAQARVDIASADEFGTLGAAFNEMAERLEHQMRSLAGLALIDRDILNGAAIDAVVDHIVDQLAQRYPQAVVGVAWLDAPTQPRLRSTLRDGTAGERERPAELTLAAPEAAALARLKADALHERAALQALPWAAQLCRDGVTRVATLPVAGMDGDINAWLLLGLRARAGRATLHEAGRLRDRLTVALAARQREQTLAYRAGHDSLTGLLNRHGLGEALERCLADPRGPRCAVLFIDLDHFKYINDSLGHEAGDEVLREVARRLRQSMPEAALLARPGGDEFVVVLPHADEGAAGSVAARLVRQLTRPIAVGGGEHVIGGSVGIALAPQHGQRVEDLLRRADMAMYVAKGNGRGQWALFDRALDEAAQTRVHRLMELRRAVECQEFVAFFQPRVSVADGRIVSAEALVRWRHPERGLLGPGEFIALAEESELIEGIGAFMIQAACKQAAAWRRAGGPIRRVSVNVSARQLARGRLPAQVRTALAEHELPPDALELEVTESLLVGDAGSAWAQLSDLRRLGVKIALDDFGTGYSSMATLRQLPIDVMKVDRAFVKDLGRDAGALAITRAIVALARSLKLHLVAEGVETEAQAQVLRRLGCDELQGFLYSKPLPPAQLERQLAEAAAIDILIEPA